MRRAFAADDTTLPYPKEEEITAVLRKMKKFTVEDELDCGACGYTSCREKAAAVCQGLAEPEMCLPYLIEGLEEALKNIEKSHKELKAAQDQLIHAEKLASVGQLSAGVAHELNNPLGSILLYAHLLLKQLKGDEKRAEDINMIVSEATRCKNIVRDLLHFSRQGSVKREPTNIHDLIERSLDASGSIEGFKKIKIVRRFADGIPPMPVDGGQLQQVFTNIISNAVWAMKDGADGTLTVTTRLKDRSAVEILVEDTGCGISKENLKKLFTPFFTTKKMGEGTGLGLAITYGIIKMHSGQISAESTVGKGTTFRIELPLACAQGEGAKVLGTDR
jgi:signal transduction histidine kinase